jgi:flagellar basal-body rod modification protein FlgD
MATASILQNLPSGAWNTMPAATPNGPTAASVQASDSGATASGSGDSTVISANDFLTLLVTEMQNQDPTADTDPNEYINQLVQVNSLEQLIQMNQTLSTALGSSSSAGSGSTANVASASPAPAAAPGASAASVLSATGSKPAQQITAAGKGAPSNNLLSGLSQFAGNNAQNSPLPAAFSRTQSVLPGNLGASKASPAAMRVAHALDGKKSH